MHLHANIHAPRFMHKHMVNRKIVHWKICIRVQGRKGKLLRPNPAYLAENYNIKCIRSFAWCITLKSRCILLSHPLIPFWVNLKFRDINPRNKAGRNPLIFYIKLDYYLDFVNNAWMFCVLSRSGLHKNFSNARSAVFIERNLIWTVLISKAFPVE